MMNRKSIFAILVLLTVSLSMFVSCGKEDVPSKPERIFGNAVRLQPYNLPTMDADICYELWLVDFEFEYDADSVPVPVAREEMSLGKFYWDRYAYQFYDINHNPVSDVFRTVGGRNVYDFNVLMITFETPVDDGVRANNGLLYADIVYGFPIRGVFNFFGDVSRSVVAELVDPRLPMTAGYVFGTYSDDGNPETRQASGIWFHSIVQAEVGFEFAHTLRIPAFTTSANFVYEGWIKMPGKLPRPISTGKFKNPYYQDWSNPHVGPYGYPNLPGEEFLYNPPEGFEGLFPLELYGGDDDTVFITIEPYPDPNPLEPFPLRLFDRGKLPTAGTLEVGESFDMKNTYGRLPSFDAEVLEL